MKWSHLTAADEEPVMLSLLSCGHLEMWDHRGTVCPYCSYILWRGFELLMIEPSRHHSLCYVLEFGRTRL